MTARHDLIAWLTGTCPDEVEPLPTDLVDTDVRIAGWIFRTTLPGPPPARHHFHVEVQTAGKAGMGLRMLRYWSKAKEALLREEEEPRISSVVIYLDRGQYRPDQGQYRADEGFGTTCAFGYRVVKLWEVDPAEILAFADPGLAPLLPLTRHDDPLRAVIESMEKIVGASPDLAFLKTVV